MLIKGHVSLLYKFTRRLNFKCTVRPVKPSHCVTNKNYISVFQGWNRQWRKWSDATWWCIFRSRRSGLQHEVRLLRQANEYRVAQDQVIGMVKLITTEGRVEQVNSQLSVLCRTNIIHNCKEIIRQGCSLFRVDLTPFYSRFIKLNRNLLRDR